MVYERLEQKITSQNRKRGFDLDWTSLGDLQGKAKYVQESCVRAYKYTISRKEREKAQ
jgi:hypothetical protein